MLGTVSEVVTAPERARRRQRLLWLGGAGGALARELGGADPGRILAAKHGGMRSDMAKHIPQSLLERAAELYDFGAALRAPAPAPVPKPAPPAEPVPAPAPGPAPAAEPRRRARAAPIDRRRPRRVRAPASRGVAEIDRAALAASRLHRSRGRR